MRTMTILAAAATLVAYGVAAIAQEDPIDADRDGKYSLEELQVVHSEMTQEAVYLGR